MRRLRFKGKLMEELLNAEMGVVIEFKVLWYIGL